MKLLNSTTDSSIVIVNYKFRQCAQNKVTGTSLFTGVVETEVEILLLIQI